MSLSQVENAQKPGEDKKKKIIDLYKKDIPYLEDILEISEQPPELEDYSYIGKSFLLRNKDITFKNFIYSVNDIRNNIAPVSDTSNTIKNSDNRYSNELKSIGKRLIHKGYSYDDIIFELDKIYGNGIVTSNKYFEKDYKFQTNFCNLFFFSLTSITLGCCYKIYKIIKK